MKAQPTLSLILFLITSSTVNAGVFFTCGTGQNMGSVVWQNPQSLELYIEDYDYDPQSSFGKRVWSAMKSWNDTGGTNLNIDRKVYTESNVSLEWWESQGAPIEFIDLVKQNIHNAGARSSIYESGIFTTNNNIIAQTQTNVLTVPACVSNNGGPYYWGPRDIVVNRNANQKAGTTVAHAPVNASDNFSDINLVLAHEIGHWVGLQHWDVGSPNWNFWPSIMHISYPTGGNLRPIQYADDRQGYPLGDDRRIVRSKYPYGSAPLTDTGVSQWLSPQPGLGPSVTNAINLFLSPDFTNPNSGPLSAGVGAGYLPVTLHNLGTQTRWVSANVYMDEVTGGGYYGVGSYGDTIPAGGFSTGLVWINVPSFANKNKFYEFDLDVGFYSGDANSGNNFDTTGRKWYVQ